MLGRAVKDHSVPIAKPPPPKPAFASAGPAAQNGNIQDQFNQSRQSSKSIGGFTGYKNSQAVLQTKSSNQKFVPAKKDSSYGGFQSSASTVSTTSSTFSRGSSTASTMSTASSRTNTSGLQRVLSKQDAFSNTPDTIIDLEKNDAALKKQLMLSQQHVAFDENDFDDDLDLDIDEDYDLPMTMGAPPKPAPKAAIEQPPQLPLHPTNTAPASSAQSWSSSPPSHKITPQRRPREEDTIPEASLDSSQPIRAAHQPRAAKRRTLPWLAKKAEEEAEAARLEELEEEPESSSASAKKCFRCGGEDHFTSDCQNKGKGTSAYNFTPLPKDKTMPWNTTASKIAQDKKDLKGKQVKRKAADAELEETLRRRDKKARMRPITLSDEQERVKDLVVNQQKSVFFTGSAGTGKSVLMRSIIADLRVKYKNESDRVAVTASTGLAACNIGGVTLHSFGGIGLGKEDVPTLVKKIKKNQKAKNRWIKTKILVIDEISMVDGDLFDKLEAIARLMRNNGRPFGGIQLVITGDFFQLPPVPDFDNKSRGAKFAFDAATWSTAVHHTIGLTEVFRQKDPVFANMLNEMRLGKISEETIQAFRKLSRKINYNDSLDATELFPTRNEVENANSFRMRSLAGKLYNFEAADSGTISDVGMRDKLLANMMAPKTLSLKKGSQVMLIKNMDDNLVNGSLGKVVAFMNEKTFEIYHENPDVLDESIPINDLGEEERSQRTAIKAKVGGGKEYPLVRFALADGTSRDLLVMPEEWKVELPSGEIQAQRAQLPLILAWALSIHKAQGQTLERVKIDLKKIFEKGQAYVALSRATSQAGLEVLNFDKSKVMAHPRVAQFYDSLYSVNKALEHPTVARPPALKNAPSYEERFRRQGGVYDLDEEAPPSRAYG